ncbi:hypothetical protein [Streptococcus loxodontisalivarius]|uniref:Uncharacterized protein n=1 Tax=Streptococcus loxodontisalivarius TaxID=1349415 RepID=A0ABS2PRV2_9STRE|nr:hypothetical protein [Streptococcus loxodontisalivarius]MBM7642767.1 hypothetical protein [Streptococcus loxodontisalivarius]
MKKIKEAFKALGDYVSPPIIVISDRHYFIPMFVEVMLLVFALIGKLLVGPFKDDFFDFFIIVMIVTILITLIVWLWFRNGMKNTFTKLFALVILFVSQVEFLEFVIQFLIDKSKIYIVWMIMPTFYLINTGYRLVITRISMGKSRKTVLNRLYFLDGFMYALVFILAFLDRYINGDLYVYGVVVLIVSYWELLYQGYIGALRKDLGGSSKNDIKRYDEVISLLKENKEKEEENEGN